MLLFVTRIIVFVVLKFNIVENYSGFRKWKSYNSCCSTANKFKVVLTEINLKRVHYKTKKDFQKDSNDYLPLTASDVGRR